MLVLQGLEPPAGGRAGARGHGHPGARQPGPRPQEADHLPGDRAQAGRAAHVRARFLQISNRWVIALGS